MCMIEIWWEHRIRNTENVQDKVVGISSRRCDQFKPNVVWGVLGKVIQSNARFGLADRLEVHFDHFRMPAGNGREKTKGWSLDVMSVIKKSIVFVKATMYCLVHALIIAIARANGDPKYPYFRDGRGMKKPVEDILKASGVNYVMPEALTNCSSSRSTFRTTKLLFMMV